MIKIHNGDYKYAWDEVFTDEMFRLGIERPELTREQCEEIAAKVADDALADYYAGQADG